MPRTSPFIEKIRAELAWVNETPDPTNCGCRNARCCECEGHEGGRCSRPPTNQLWTFRWEHFCPVCREYAWGGSKTRTYMTTKG